MHVFVVDRPGREAALLTIERLAAFAEVAAAQANERDEDGVHSTSPHEGTLGAAVYDPQADRNMAFALAYAALVGRILPLGTEVAPGALLKERLAESGALLEDMVASIMGAVRCKAHTLPMLTVQEIDILHMVDVCVATTRTLAPQVALEVHSDTSVPRSITCDSAKSRAALLALLIGAFRREGASPLGYTAVVLVRSVVPKPNAPPSIIRIELQVVGAEGSQSAITTRQLSTELQLDPLTDVMAPPSRVSKDVSQLDIMHASSKLHKYTLGTARHLALAMGGNLGVSQGAPALSDSNGVTFWLHVPVTTQPRAYFAGPNAQPLSLLRQRITTAALPRLAKDPFTPHDVPVQKVPDSASPTQGGSGAAHTPPSSAAPAPAPAPAAAARGRQLPPNIQNLGKHILFVDDEQVNRRLGSRMMQRLGCTYKLLTDGDEVAGALEVAAAEKPFDMIIIDIVMQRTDGAVVCSQLRATGVNMPIIAMTGNTGARDVKRFLAAGFDMMLAKPFDILGLGRAIVEAPARRERTLTKAQANVQQRQQQAAAHAHAAGVEMSSAE
jgi:CheY-like chemotaxis protein